MKWAILLKCRTRYLIIERLLDCSVTNAVENLNTKRRVLPGYGILPYVTNSVRRIPKLQTSDLIENLE